MWWYVVQCVFSLWKGTLVLHWRILFNRRTRCGINTLWLFIFIPYHKIVCPFRSQDSFDSPVDLFVWLGFFCLLQSFQTKTNQKLLMWCSIPQSSGVLICKRELRALGSLISWMLFCAWDQQTGDRTHSWVYPLGQCALNTENSFGLVDVNANFYHAGLNTFWARLQKIRVWCHDQVTVGSQSKFLLSGL